MELSREDGVTQNSIILDFSQLPGQDPDTAATAMRVAIGELVKAIERPG